MKVIGQVKYIGDTDPLSFIDGKIYNVIEVIGNSIRVIDEIEDYLYTVSYTHLDVYKRQTQEK